MKLKYLLAASVVSLAATTTIATPAFAQETTSSVRGDVVDQNGNPVVGAVVTVTHAPSGTKSTQTTDGEGGFNAAGLRLGGPFTVEVSAGGFETVTQEIGFLSAGQAQRISVALAEQGQTIVVTGARQRSAITLSTGAATVLTARDIAGVANINRDVRNLAARDPLVTLDATNNGAISIAGQNNRFNRFTVDGVAFSDPFGLESGGLVSSRGPVPLDAIGEFSVETAPVDIQQGFFQGGAINTQLKSGGNSFTMLGAAFYQNDDLRGSRADNLRRIGAFDSQVYVAQVTGPIIKDKLFFAVTYERTRDTVPADVDPSQLLITDAEINAISATAQSVYNYDTLGVASDIVEKDDKLITKLDWNVADGHRLTATYIWNDSAQLLGQTGVGQIANIGNGNPTYNLLSNNYTAGAKNHFGIIQSNNQWSDAFSTQLRVSYADYVRLQQPLGGREFGQFQVCLDPVNPAPPAVGGAPNGSAPQVCSPGQQRINFGPDISRQANELDSQSLAIEFAATLKVENHTIKLIAERRRQDVRNLFAQRVSGAWLFDNLADFQARRANELDYAVPLRGGIDTVTAEFQNNSWTFGIMDTIDVTDNLTVVAGVRYDLFDSPDRPFFNEFFQTRFGFSNTETLNGRDLFQPRFGVNWKPTDRLQVRGSAGLFGGGNPLVWISNNFSNPGPTLQQVRVRRNADGTFTIPEQAVLGLTTAQVQTLGAATLNNVSGGPGVPPDLIAAVRRAGFAGSPTNALDPNFEAPSQWRFSGSVDYEADLGFLGDGWNFGADVIYSNVNNALEWTDLRSVEQTGANATLPDGRTRYNVLPAAAGENTDMLLTNTSFGESWNVVARFDKRWNSGFFLSGSYTFQDVQDQNPGTSSVAFSNYQNTAFSDPNFAAQGIANYQRDDQFRLVTGFDGELFGDNNTRVELFYNLRSGQRYSHTFQDITNGRSAVFGVNGRGTRGLLYVPNVSSQTADARVVYDSAATFAAFQALVQNSELNAYQGEIAPKNIGKTPWVHKLDLSVRQEVPFVFGGKLELMADVENMLNLIDKDWGTIQQVGFPYTAAVVNVQCLQTAGGAAATTPAQPCAQYRYSNFRAPNEATNINGSLWGVRFGVRVRF